MTQLDSDIKDALDTVGVEFYPVMYQNNGLIGVTNDPKQTGCLSMTVETSPIQPNGNVIATQNFYMYQRRNVDVDILNDINEKQLLNTQNINTFVLLMSKNKNYRVSEAQSRKPFIDILDCLECGQEFILNIEYNANKCS